MLAISAFLSFVLIAAFIWFRAIWTKVQSTGVQRVQNLNGAISILRNSTLESRAMPNERLIRAFGIENSFTTTIPSVHRSFVKTAHRLLRTDDNEFITLAIDAAGALNQKIYSVGFLERLPLVETVQVFVFRVCLNKFFPNIPSPLEEDAVSITGNINTQWIGSKKPNAHFNLTQAISRRRLESDLKKVFQLDKDSAVLHQHDANPLNILLPAYEALWQVVLSGFLEIRFRDHSDAEIWRKELRTFLRDPRECFYDTTIRNKSSVNGLMKETLRLYPPTKRIKRFHNGQLLDIDVEFMQRDAEIWGDDALVFDPERWNTITPDEERAFMPFGSGKFVCPSKKLVGPILIGIMVATLVNCLGNLWGVVGDNCEAFDFGVNPLESGRDAYKGLRLQRVKR